MKQKTNSLPRSKETELSIGSFKKTFALSWDPQWWPDLPLLWNLLLLQKRQNLLLFSPRNSLNLQKSSPKKPPTASPQLYDHEINLDETFVLKIRKIYLLSPDEKKATEDFLKKKPSLWKDLFLQFPSSLPLLLHQEEGWETLPLPGLSLSE